MIAPPMMPPAISPFWSALKPPDVGVGVGIPLDIGLEDVDVGAVVLLITVGVAVAMAPTPPNAAPEAFYDHSMAHFSV